MIFSYRMNHPVVSSMRFPMIGVAMGCIVIMGAAAAYRHQSHLSPSVDDCPCYRPLCADAIVEAGFVQRGGLAIAPIRLVPDRSSETNFRKAETHRTYRKDYLEMLVFFGERYQTELYYGKNNQAATSFTPSNERWMFLDWLTNSHRKSPTETRLLLNGIDFGADAEGENRLAAEIAAASKGTMLCVPGYEDQDVKVDRLVPSARIASELSAGLARGQLRPRHFSDDRSVCVGKVVWPGDLAHLPDAVLTWTTPNWDAYGPPKDDSQHAAQFYLNGKKMADADAVFAALEKLPERSSLLIYPFYAPLRVGGGPFTGQPEKIPVQSEVPYLGQDERLRDVVLRQRLKLTLLATPIRRAQEEVDRWLLAEDDAWHLDRLAPFGVVLGTFFHVGYIGDDILWIPDVYPRVVPLIPRPSSIVTPPKWLHYTPDRSKLRVFYAKELVFEAMHPCYCLTGVEGIERMRLDVNGATLARYTVYLHFSEPNKDAMPGERVFSVCLQGKEVLRDFDIVRDAGNPFRPLIKEFRDVQIKESLEIGFKAKIGLPVLCAVTLLRGVPPPPSNEPLHYRGHSDDPRGRSARHRSI